MKTLNLKSFLVIAIAISTLASCSKKSEDTPPPPPADPIVGKWVGSFKAAENVLSFYFAFDIKAGGSLDVLNISDEVVGKGTWKMDGGVFYCIYGYNNSNKLYNVAAKYNEEEGTIAGSYGAGEENPADGDIILVKK